MRPARDEALRGLADEAGLVALVVAMARAGVSPLLFKGPAVARWLYDDPAERSYRDIDLLVAPAEHGQARRVLAEAGFTELQEGGREGEFSPHAALWTRDRPLPTKVDLHRAPFLLVDCDHDAVWRALSTDAGTLELGGVPIAVPGAPAHGLIIATHAAQHGHRATRALEDLERALARMDDDGWHRASALARGLGAEAALAAGLRMVAPGRELADRLGLGRNIEARIRLRVDNRPAAWTAFDRLAAAPSRRARAAKLLGMVFPSPHYLRIAAPRARRGPVALGLAYLARPVRLLVRAPGGYRAWREVAREEQPRPTRTQAGPTRTQAGPTRTQAGPTRPQAGPTRTQAGPTRPERRPTGREPRPTRAGRSSPATLDAIRRAWWAARALRAARRQLRDGGLDAVRLPAPPGGRTDDERGIERGLRAGRATCLERALVRQSWHRSRGEDRELVLGVTAPTAEFGAHAWLDGDREDASAFTEILRRPADPR